MSTSSFSAPSATASAAAAVSALTLCTWPSTSGATLETTGIRPASIRSCDRLGADLGDLADQAEVDLLAVDDGVGRLGGEQAGVLAGEPDREVAVLVDQADQLALHLADQHHPDDVHRLGRGHPQAAPELRLDAEPVEHRGDLRAAAVHDDRLEAGEAQERDVLGEGLLQGRRRSSRCRRTSPRRSCRGTSSATAARRRGWRPSRGRVRVGLSGVDRRS